MENVVYNELVTRGFQVDVGVIDVVEKGKRKRVEIDFIANKGSKRYYIQSAFAIPDVQKHLQEKRPLLATNDSFKKIIVVQNNTRLSRDEHGVVTMSLKDFLLNPASLDL